MNKVETAGYLILANHFEFEAVELINGSPYATSKDCIVDYRTGEKM